MKIGKGTRRGAEGRRGGARRGKWGFSLQSPIPLLLILVLAAVLRLYNLDAFPPGLYHDEAYNGLDALALLNGETFPNFHEGWEHYRFEAHGDNPPEPMRFPLFFEGNYGREPLHVYLMAVSVWLFGNTPFAVRFVPAFAGILAVLTTFWATKELLDGNPKSKIQNPKSKIPHLAAFFLAIFMPAVHFSRFGLRVMLFVPLAGVVVACFWRGMNRDDPRWFGIAGIFTGITLYTYAVARLFPLLFILFTGYWIWGHRDTWRVFLGRMVLMGGSAGIFALPLLLFFAEYPYYFVLRLAYVANKGAGAVEGKPWLTWFNNVGRVFRGLFWRGETHLRHNLPGRPFLDAIQTIFFFFGLISLRKRLNPRTVFLLMWLGVMLLPTILSGDAPHFGRMMGAAVPLAIFCGMGVNWVLSGVRSPVLKHGAKMASPINRARGMCGLVILLLVTSAVWTTYDYFGRYQSHPQLTADFYLDDWELGVAEATLPQSTNIYLTPTQQEMATIAYALGDNQDKLRSFSPSATLLPAGIDGKDVVYWLRDENLDILPRLQTFFPNGEISHPQDNLTQFHVPANTPHIQPHHTINTNFGDEIQLLGYSLVEDGEQIHVTLFWKTLRPPTQNYTAFVHGLDNAGIILTQSDRPPAGYPTTDWRPNEIIIDTFTLPYSSNIITLSTGFYNSTNFNRLGEAIPLTP